MKQYSRDDQAALASWALDCAERVLPLFESVSEDPRPREAIESGRRWVSTRVFMREIRGASLGAHDAAKPVKQLDAACQAAHAAGQAVATAHVPQHAFGAAYYALRAVAAAHPDDAIASVRAERDRQLSELPPHLQVEAAQRGVVSEERNGRVKGAVAKGPDF